MQPLGSDARATLSTTCASRRRQLAREPLPLVELAHALEQQRAGRPLDRGALGRAGVRGTRSGRAPREQPEQRLLARRRSRARLDQVAVAHPDAPALARAARRPAELDHAGPAVHVEELEQVGERDLREPALELAAGPRVAPGAAVRLARAARAAPREARDLVGVGAAREPRRARLARPRAAAPAEEEEAHARARGFARRISASCAASISGRSAGAITAAGTSASAASSAAAPWGAKRVAKPRARHASPRRRARRRPVRDQDRSLISPRLGTPSSRWSRTASDSTSTRSQLWNSVTRPSRSAGSATSA